MYVIGDISDETSDISTNCRHSHHPGGDWILRSLVTADNQELTDVESFNKVRHYYPAAAVDNIILERKTRFAENDNKVVCYLGKILTMEKPDDESFKVVSEFYSLDEESLRSDLIILAHVNKQHFSSKCSIPSNFKHLFI